MTKKTVGLLLVAVLIGIAVTGIVKSSIEEKDPLDNLNLGNDVEFPSTEEGLAKGEMAPDFELTTLDGETVRLSDYKGRKVVLNFWTSWCPPCRAEMPHMQTYYEEKASEENVEILAVNLTSADSGLTKVKAFIEEFQITFPIPLDKEGEVGSLYQAVTIPTTYMLDTEGKVQHKILGPMDESLLGDYIANMN